MAVSAPALSRWTTCCMATAQLRAADAAGKTTMRPSPRFFTSVPPEVAMACRRAEKCLWRTSSPASGVSEEASSVEPTRSVKSTVMFSVVATEPPVPASRRKIRRDQGFLHGAAIDGPDEGGCGGRGRLDLEWLEPTL